MRFKNEQERKKFIDSYLCKHLLNHQALALNEILNGNYSYTKNYYQLLTKFLSESVLTDEKHFPILEFKELLDSEDHYAMSYNNPDNIGGGIALDERFLHLTQYKNIKELKNAEIETPFTDECILQFAINNLFHEFIHQLQFHIYASIENNDDKKEAFKIFSKHALISSSHIRDEINMSDQDAKAIFDYYLKISKNSKECVFKNLENHFYNTHQDTKVRAEDYRRWQYEELIFHIQHCAYYYAPEEVGAHLSYQYALKYFKIFSQNTLLSEKSKAFVDATIKAFSDKGHVNSFLEFDRHYLDYRIFCKMVKDIDNDKLFEFIHREGEWLSKQKRLNIKNGKPYNELCAKQLSFFLKQKDVSTVKEFFDYIMQHPSDFSFNVLKETLENDVYDVLSNYLNRKYFKYIYSSLKEDKRSISPIHIFPDMLYPQQQNKLLRFFIINHMWNHACRILDDMEFEFNGDKEIISIINQSTDEINKFYKTKRYNIEMETKKMLLFRLVPFKYSTILHEL